MHACCCIHRSGMSFTNFYTAPLCAMGRAQLLTGRD
jgi:arylsulfatase A-like enzyme